jgi:hypothetical protein
LWYDELVGGILVMNLVDLQRVNGFSNMYWAWGGEDDDMGLRLKVSKCPVFSSVVPETVGGLPARREGDYCRGQSLLNG